MRYFPTILMLLFLLVCSCNRNNHDSIIFPEGGYNYPEQIDKKDTLNYIYPIKDSISSRDSFNFSTYAEFLYESFDETNLSITPPKNPIFRFVFQHGFSRYAAIITLTENKIIVKELETGYAVPFTEIEKLDSLEQEHYNIFSFCFPLSQYKGGRLRKEYIDSITRVHPQLLDAKYYRFLAHKANSIGNEKFIYSTREIPLTKDKYTRLVKQINESGYWDMKPIIRNCIGEVTHSDGLSLEAATPNKYNFVTFMECRDDTSKFVKACAELRKISKMDEKMTHWHDQFNQKNK